jgi:predicted MFS family arabinose efflux permease
VALIGLLTAAGEGSARTFFDVYLDSVLHLSAVQIGTLAAAGQLLAVPAALAMPLLAGRWGIRRTFALGSLGIALSLLPLASIPLWGAAGLSFMSLVALASIRRPAFMVFSQEIVSARWRAAMSGATSMAVGLSFSIVSLCGGFIITSLGYSSLFLAGAGITAAGVLLFWAYFRVPRGEFARRSAAEEPGLLAVDTR